MHPSTDLPQDWHSRRVLVTGAGGFIGSHLVEVLVRNGAQVSAFVRYTSRGEPGLLSSLESDLLARIKLIRGDLRDPYAVKEAARDADTIFHLGALIAIPYSYLHPAEVVETNVIGTLNVLLAAREWQTQRVVQTSSSEVYGTAIRVPIDESHPLQGQSPYSASKIGADKLAESFYCSYQLPVVLLRPFNTYGPRQSARAVIPSIISQALTQDTIRVGNLDSRRDFTYISDTVNGFLCAAMTPGVEGQTFNLGVGCDISIRSLVEKILALIGKPVQIFTDNQRLRPERSEVQRLISDNRLAAKYLDWHPSIDLDTGLKNTIEWIARHLEFYQPHQYQL